jgi:hypothetical protein
MEKVPGIPLGTVWDSLQPPDKLKVFLQVFKYQKRWSAAKFSQFGSLYYTEDLTVQPSRDDNLYIDQDGKPVKETRFAVGPAVGREWVQDGRKLGALVRLLLI